MKKIFTLSTLALLTVVILTSCYKSVRVGNNDNYWLSQERGDVVYSDSYCNYYVVETNYGYTIIRSTSSSYRPYEGSVIYGNFGNYGTRDFYNYSNDIIVRGEVVEYDLSYNDAQLALDYYCPQMRQYGGKIKQSATSTNKVARVATTGSQDKQ